MYSSFFSALIIWLACIFSHAVVYRRPANRETHRIWQDATRLPSLLLCFVGPLWWWAEAETARVGGRAVLEGGIVFLLGACLIEGSLALTRRRSVAFRGSLQGVAYFTLSLVSFGVALASSLHPRLVVLPLVCTALLFVSLNLARLALIQFSQSGGLFWSYVRAQILPWLLPLLSVGSVFYLQSQWEHTRVVELSVIHIRLIFQSLALALLGEGLLSAVYYLRIQYWVEGSWYRDFFRTLLFLAIGWHYLSQATGRNVADLMVGSAFLSVGLGFALKPTVGNFAAGLVSRLSPSFSIGDYISVKKHFARVTRIDWRSTALQGRDGDLLVLPNVLMTSQHLVNHSIAASGQANWAKVVIDARASPQRVQSCILRALQSHGLIDKQRVPQVFLAGFSASGLEYRMLYWFQDPSAQPLVESSILAHLDYCLRRDGLTLASPVLLASVNPVVGRPIED